MGINSVDMNKALSSESYAAQCIRSGKLTGSQRCQLAAQWGADKIKLWESVDSTDYKISDDDFDAAKSSGRKKAEEETGHDGSKQSWVRVGADALGSAAGALGAAAPSLLGKGIHNGLNKMSSKNVSSWTNNQTGQSGTNQMGDQLSDKTKGDKNLGDITTIVLTAAVALKYRLSKPNEDQHDAAMKLYNASEGSGVLADGQASLNEAQEIMQDATEQTTELTEEAEEINEDANEDIDDNKTNFDFFRKQYEYLKAKAQSGEELTPDEKQMLKKLAPLMEEASANISSAQDEASTALSDKSDEIAAFQSDYDDGAETIAEVQGVTDFAEGFDSATRTMAYIEGVSQGLNGASAGVAAGRLAAKSGLGFWLVAPFVAIGAATVTSSAFASTEQFKWAGEIGQEIDVRESVQDLGSETEDVYNEELDNFAGNLDIIDDLELEVPEDTAIPDAPVETVDKGSNIDPLAAGAAGVNVNNTEDDNDNDNIDPLAAGAAGVDVKDTDEADDTDKTGADGNDNSVRKDIKDEDEEPKV